ncbi:hypothetical protein RI570_08835 [Brucella pseudogrignonensis]|uniref:hypothetical protein n=1 Tax=Brucella pseudogrignonensis TaxID=419475 RepID=UPI0028B6D5FF|nr:hypothetical protein [Brucella pseudogrignonensis]MDT6940250.1 hypothetical protein [Brucella pseudogrignonensis]
MTDGFFYLSDMVSYNLIKLEVSMSDNFTIEFEQNYLQMSAYDSKKVTGYLKENGVGFSGKINLLTPNSGGEITIDDSDNIFSSDDGTFIFTVNSAYDEVSHHFGSGIKIVEKKVLAIYVADGGGEHARTSFIVGIKPPPI